MMMGLLVPSSGSVQIDGLDCHADMSVHAAPFSDGMTRGITMLMSVLWLFSVLYPFALSMRSGPDRDFEWIATLPMSRPTLLCARIGERAIVNPTGWFLFKLASS
jgi:ABC-2 type transport system permease protein